MEYIKNINFEEKLDVKCHIETLLEKDKIKKEGIYYPLLEECIDYIYKNKSNKELARCLLEPFDEDEDMGNILIMICRDFVCDREVAKYIKNIFNDLSNIVLMLIILFDKRKNINYGIIAENLLYCYDYELTNFDIDEIIQNLSQYEEFRKDPSCESIKCYLESKRIFDKESYQKPEWVNLIDGENISMLTSVSTGESELSKKDVKFEKILEENRNFFYKVVPEESNTFIKDIPDEIEKALRIFLETSSKSEENGLKLGNPNRVWGPENRMKDKECCSGPEGEGPCRMLQCECLEDYDEDDTYTPSMGMTWFTGECDSCEGKIMDPSHALRFPNEEGSWKGCYCSFDCLKEDPPYELTDKASMLISIYRLIIEHYGVMDRSSAC